MNAISQCFANYLWVVRVLLLSVTRFTPITTIECLHVVLTCPLSMMVVEESSGVVK